MHVMVDGEFLGSQDDARFIQLSAVAFELNGTVLEPHELLQYDDRWFNATVAHYDGSTEQSNIEFWAHPERADARGRIFAQEAEPIEIVLARFAQFTQRWLGKRGHIWAKPPRMDLRILEGNYRRVGFDMPWHWKQEHDLRTLVWAARKVPRTHFRIPDMTGAGLIEHYALHDAVEQAIVAQAAFQALTLSVAESRNGAGAKLSLPVKEKSNGIQSAESRA